KLAETPKPALRLLRYRLRPAAAADPKRTAQLIDKLDDPEFAVREKATDELEQLHELVSAALNKALAAGPSLEARRRLEALLQRVQRRQHPAATMRALRGVEVLDAIGTPPARQQLETLTTGAPEALLTKEARAALERLAQHTSSHPAREKHVGSGYPG